MLQKIISTPTRQLIKKKPPSPPITIGKITPKQVEWLQRYILTRLQSKNPSKHTQIITLTRSDLSLIKTMENALRFQTNIKGLYIDTHDKVQLLKTQKAKDIIQQDLNRARAAYMLPATGIILWATYLGLTLISNNNEKTIPESWAKGIAIQDTTIFFSFGSVFSSIIFGGFMLAARLIQELPKEQILKFPKFSSFHIMSKTKPEELIGTPNHPGHLFNSLLVIHSPSQLTDSSILDTVVSNGGFSFPTQPYKPKTWIPFNGTVIIISDDPLKFPEITRLSGRLLNINQIPSMPSTPQTSDHSSTNRYDAINVSETPDDPYELFIGRDQEINAILAKLYEWADNWKNQKYSPCIITLHDTHKDLFGTGKTSLATQCIKKLLAYLDENEIEIPQVELVETGGKVISRYAYTKQENYLSAKSIGYGAWGIAAAAIIGEATILGQSQNYIEEDIQSQLRLTLFCGLCLAVSAGIWVLGALGYLNLYLNFANTNPNIISESNPRDINQISSTPNSEDCFGEYAPSSKRKQLQYSPSKNAELIFAQRFNIFECGAIDALPNDTELTLDNKYALMASIISAKESGTYNIGNYIPTPFDSVMFITSNQTRRSLNPLLINQSDLILGLPPIIPFNSDKDKEKLLIQLKKENKAINGYDFTDDALTEFIQKVHFRNQIPRNHIILVRQYWQVLLPYLNLITAEKGLSTICSTTVQQGWNTMVNHTHKDYFDRIIASQRSSR